MRQKLAGSSTARTELKWITENTKKPLNSCESRKQSDGWGGSIVEMSCIFISHLPLFFCTYFASSQVKPMKKLEAL